MPTTNEKTKQTVACFFSALQQKVSIPSMYFANYSKSINIRVANHVTSDERVHGVSENKLFDSGYIFLDIFRNTCQN